MPQVKATVADQMTKSAYARHRGVSPAMVTKWRKSNRLVMSGEQVLVAESDALLARELDPLRGGKNGKSDRGATTGHAPAPARARRGRPRLAGSPSGDLLRERTRREKLMADEAEFRAAVRRGEYIDRAGVRLAIGDAGREIVQALDAIPGRVGGQMAAEFGVPEHSMFRLLEDTLNEFREDVAQRLRDLAAKYPETHNEGADQ